MLTLIPTTEALFEIERDIQNSDAYFNRVTKDKDVLTDEEIAQEIKDAAEMGAERFLLKNGEDYVGIIDFLMENPRDHYPWLGLLHIHKRHQSKGYGGQAFQLYCDMMKERGVEAFRLGAIVGNEPAHRFWQSRACKPVRESTLKDGKAVIVYEKELL